MKRREFMLCACAALVAARAGAQSVNAPRRVGLLMPATREFSKPQLEAFTARLAELGHVEGRDVVIDKRWAGGAVGQLPALARELLALKPQVVVAPSSPVAAAFKKATSTVPIVFTAVTFPEKYGFVASLARPGGNMTGIAYHGDAMATKLGELVRETLPARRRLALLLLDHPAAREQGSAVQRNLAALGFKVERFLVTRSEDFGSAFEHIARWPAELVFVDANPLFATHARELNTLAAKARLPLFGARRAFADGGGLLSYDNDLKVNYRRAAEYVDRILRGAKPAELPVDQPERFQLVVNLRTARALGITVPTSVLLQATEVIE